MKTTFSSIITLHNSHVLLRPMFMNDFDTFRTITGTPSMWVWFTDDLSDPLFLHKWISAAVRETAEGKRLAFTVIDLKSDRIAGSTSFGNFSSRDGRVEIGWTWLGLEFQGKGLNRDMKYLMMKYGFEDLGLDRVESKTDVLNIPARKGLERAGMKEEGILRSHTLMTNQRRRDTIYYSVLKDEWPAVRDTYLKATDTA